MSDAARETAQSTGYLHGFTREEQDRLFVQARFLEPFVFEGIDLDDRRHLLEVGCGVGAQTDILLRRFPQLRITGVDASAVQVERARSSLAESTDRLTFQVADATALPFPIAQFDSAFFCWLLEHVADPVRVLSEARRVLQPGARVVCVEVMNASLFLSPHCPNTMAYWAVFNEHQRTLHGDPFVGTRLGNLLLDAGYTDVVTSPRTFHWDNRKPDMRAAFLDYWRNLLLSGAEGLRAAGKVKSETVAGMQLELEQLRHDPQGVFFYTFMQAQARVPQSH